MPPSFAVLLRRSWRSAWAGTRRFGDSGLAGPSGSFKPGAMDRPLKLVMFDFDGTLVDSQ
jgi:hypothetical protein